MKVVHINFWDKRGGAAIAANRLHKAMISEGIDSKMLVFDKFYSDKSVIAIDTFLNKFKISLFQIMESRLLAKFRPFIGNFSISFWGLNVSSHQLIKEADVIYLHWINNGFISISTVEKILKLNKPVFWFLHDMWAFTGGCHHSFNCTKYQTQCGSCMVLNSKKTKDISYRVLNSKISKIASYTNLNIITPSRWLAECAKSSTLLSKHQATVIPNLVDVLKFKKLAKSNCRKILGLPFERKIILFGADLGAANPYKGWDYLRQALEGLEATSYLLVTFGGEVDSVLAENLPFDTLNLGRLFDDYSMSMLYNACDVFVIPSLAESFGQTALEAMACGTPVVGFNIGGIPDIIQHKQTGYLANYKDKDDLRAGITWVLEECNDEEIAKNCRAITLTKFSSKVVIEQHIQLISQLN